MSVARAEQIARAIRSEKLTVTSDADWSVAIGAASDKVEEVAKTWALLMQIEMRKPSSLEDAARATATETLEYCLVGGEVLAQAVNLLERGWAYGPQLRKWWRAEGSKRRRR